MNILTVTGSLLYTKANGLFYDISTTNRHVLKMTMVSTFPNQSIPAVTLLKPKDNKS